MINEWNGGEENDGVADDDGDDDDGDGGGEGVKYNWSHWRWNVYCAQELGRENVQKAERQQKQNGQPWIILFPFHNSYGWNTEVSEDGTIRTSYSY